MATASCRVRLRLVISQGRERAWLAAVRDSFDINEICVEEAPAVPASPHIPVSVEASIPSVGFAVDKLPERRSFDAGLVSKSSIVSGRFHVEERSEVSEHGMATPARVARSHGGRADEPELTPAKLPRPPEPHGPALVTSRDPDDLAEVQGMAKDDGHVMPERSPANLPRPQEVAPSKNPIAVTARSVLAARSQIDSPSSTLGSPTALRVATYSSLLSPCPGGSKTKFFALTPDGVRAVRKAACGGADDEAESQEGRSVPRDHARFPIVPTVQLTVEPRLPELPSRAAAETCACELTTEELPRPSEQQPSPTPAGATPRGWGFAGEAGRSVFPEDAGRAPPPGGGGGIEDEAEFCEAPGRLRETAVAEQQLNVKKYTLTPDLTGERVGWTSSGVSSPSTPSTCKLRACRVSPAARLGRGQAAVDLSRTPEKLPGPPEAVPEDVAKGKDVLDPLKLEVHGAHSRAAIDAVKRKWASRQGADLCWSDSFAIDYLNACLEMPANGDFDEE